MPSIEVPLLPDEPSAILEEAPPPASLQSPALPGIPEFISPNLESFMEAVIDIPEQPPEVDFAPPPSERVDAAPAPQPEPEVTIAETEQEEIVPSEDAEPDLPAIEQEATARIEASTRIVTEAEEEPQALFSVAPLLRPANLETASREAEDVSPTEPEPPQEPSESEQIRSAILQDKRDLENPGSSGGDENTAIGR